MSDSPRWRLLPAAVTGFALASALWAQTSSEVNAGFQFNFSNPGARSLALGGAFTGLADDATAAYTNPAGLTNLSRPEVSLEGRYFEYKNEFLDRGHAVGSPSNKGLDNVAGSVFEESKDHVTDLSFVSFVYPRSRWAISIYRQQLADFKASAQTFGAFFDLAGTSPAVVARFFPIQGSVRLKIANYGISGAVRVTDTLSLGAGASRYEYRQTTNLTRYNVGDLYNDPPTYTSPFVVGQESALGDDSDTSFNVGALWKPSRLFSLGVVYRRGPHFRVMASNQTLPGGTLKTATGELRVPDVYGVGIALRPTDALTFSVDLNRVRYSQLTDSFIEISTVQPTAAYRADDGNEYRLGVQYAIPVGGSVLAIRVGGWSDPDHRIRSIGPAQDQQILFRPGKVEYHGSGGLGLAIGEHLQFDLGADISQPVKTGSASAVVRF